MSSSQTSVEHVLVIPTLLFHQVGHFQGVSTDVERYLKVLLDPQYASYRPRPEVEEDPSFKQLIPYCIFTHEGNIFHYQRGGGVGEQRLKKKRSIGVGGHISSDDQHGQETVYRTGMLRELAEEVSIEAEATETLVGLINDDLTPVGQVHLGMIHRFELSEPKLYPREDDMVDAGFSSPKELLDRYDEFESWSQIALDALFRNI